jgi:hypothetical protein
MKFGFEIINTDGHYVAANTASAQWTTRPPEISAIFAVFSVRDHEEVEIAIRPVISPCSAAEQENLLWMQAID